MRTRKGGGGAGVRRDSLPWVSSLQQPPCYQEKIKRRYLAVQIWLAIPGSHLPVLNQFHEWEPSENREQSRLSPFTSDFIMLTLQHIKSP